MTIKDLYSEVSVYPTMPALFIGHGSPMNALEDNEFTKRWTSLGDSLPTPKAIVCISAHWETRGTYITAMHQQKTIHDFYGFPNELFEQTYPASGYPELAKEIQDGVNHTPILDDHEWGLDHGAWSVLKHMYPQANIPTIQISMDRNKDAKWHYEFAKELAFLRTKGVLVVGSGNMIHNLRIMRISGNDFNVENGYDWAFELNNIFKQKIRENDFQSLVNYKSLHKDIDLAIPTPEHYIPLLYTLAMQGLDEHFNLFCDKVIAGSLSMTSLMIG